MANEQDIVDAIRQLQNDNAQMLRTLQQMSSAIQQLARSGGARAGGVNAGPRNPNSLKDRLIARTTNQAERSLAIKAGRALISPAETAFGAVAAGLRGALGAAATGADPQAGQNRGFARFFAGGALDNALFRGALGRGESTIERAQGRVGSVNEEIVRQGGTLSGQALDFQNRLALTQERRVTAFRRRQEAGFTNLSGTERAFEFGRATQPDNPAFNDFTTGLGVDKAAEALEKLAKGAEKARDALDPRSVH